MQKNFDDVLKENIKQNNPNQSQIPDDPYRILLIGSSASEKNKLIIESNKSTTRY